jgi:hypothetical protein
LSINRPGRLSRLQGGAELKDQHAQLAAQPFESGLHKMLYGQARVQKRGVGFARLAFLAAYLGIGNAGRAFDDKAEVGIDLSGKGGILAGRQRPPEGAVDADGAQQRVLVIGRQAFLASTLLS